jgi:hypothetical protein
MDMICRNCGHLGPSSSVTKGSTAIELVLWLCFILPGLIYSLWRLSSRHSACPKCGNTGMIPLDSPRGKQLVAQFHPNERLEAADGPASQYRGSAARGWVWIALILAVVVIVVWQLAT